MTIQEVPELHVLDSRRNSVNRGSNLRTLRGSYGGDMSEQVVRKQHHLRTVQPQQPQLEAASKITVLMNGNLPPPGREVDVEYHIDESVRTRGHLESRIVQQQAVGSILALLRGFQVLRCTGKFDLTVKQGEAECNGKVTAPSATQKREAQKIISGASRLVHEFAWRYPESSFKLSCSTDAKVSNKK